MQDPDWWHTLKVYFNKPTYGRKKQINLNNKQLWVINKWNQVRLLQKERTKQKNISKKPTQTKPDVFFRAFNSENSHCNFTVRIQFFHKWGHPPLSWSMHQVSNCKILCLLSKIHCCLTKKQAVAKDLKRIKEKVHRRHQSVHLQQKCTA